MNNPLSPLTLRPVTSILAIAFVAACAGFCIGLSARQPLTDDSVWMLGFVGGLVGVVGFFNLLYVAGWVHGHVQDKIRAAPARPGPDHITPSIASMPNGALKLQLALTTFKAHGVRKHLFCLQGDAIGGGTVLLPLAIDASMDEAQRRGIQTVAATLGLVVPEDQA